MIDPSLKVNMHFIALILAFFKKYLNICRDIFGKSFHAEKYKKDKQFSIGIMVIWYFDSV